MELAQKDQLLEIYPGARLGLPIICLGLSVPSDEPCSSAPDRLLKVMDLQGSGSEHGTRTNLLFTMSYRTGTEPKARRKPFFFMDECFLSTPRIWWSRTGSNRRHPACKAGALPAELRPLITFVLKEVVGLGGLEPPTSRLSSARSNQLSYKPLAELSKSPQIRSEAPQARLRVAAYAAPSRSASTRRVRYGA